MRVRRTMVMSENWRRHAACWGMVAAGVTDLWFPAPGASQHSPAEIRRIADAKAICKTCPVRMPCLAFAVRTGQQHGIWGGLTENQRKHSRLCRALRQQFAAV